VPQELQELQVGVVKQAQPDLLEPQAIQVNLGKQVLLGQLALLVKPERRVLLVLKDRKVQEVQLVKLVKQAPPELKERLDLEDTLERRVQKEQPDLPVLRERPEQQDQLVRRVRQAPKVPRDHEVKPGLEGIVG
jgi:hypothetical protein